MWGDYRTLPRTWSLLLLAACGRGRVVAVAVLAGLLFTLVEYKRMARPQFDDVQARIDVFAAQTAGTLVYGATRS